MIVHLRAQTQEREIVSRLRYLVEYGELDLNLTPTYKRTFAVRRMPLRLRLKIN